MIKAERMQVLDSPGPCPPIETIGKRLKKTDCVIWLIKQGRHGSGWNLTCDQTLAGISSGECVNAKWGIWNLVSPIFDGDGVTARHVRHVRHCVRSVPVVPNVGLLWLPLWILELAHKHNSGGHASNRAS